MTCCTAGGGSWGGYRCEGAVEFDDSGAVVDDGDDDEDSEEGEANWSSIAYSLSPPPMVLKHAISSCCAMDLQPIVYAFFHAMDKDEC